MIAQKTIEQAFLLEGIGLHSGLPVKLTIHPAPENYGVVFEKMSDNSAIKIKACYKSVYNTLMCTSLSNDKNEKNQIRTVEHLLSAIYALGIDNLIIKIKGDEVPIMDGSSGPFFYGLNEIGIKEQNEAKKYLKILKEVRVSNQYGHAVLLPCDGFKLFFEIDFKHPSIKKSIQTYSIDLSNGTKDYESVSNARTFGFVEDAKKLKKQNLALGASIHNAIFLTKESMDSGQTLRHKAEFVQHKLLDSVGDLSLCGFNLMASYHGYKAGHKLNHELIYKIFADKNNYQII